MNLSHETPHPADDDQGVIDPADSQSLPLPRNRPGILQHIGRTPLVPLERLARGLPVSVLAKCEHLNPGGSIKDRIALAIVEDAEARGGLRLGMTLVEATAGNTGVGLALTARGGLDGPVVTVLPDAWDRYRAKPWMQEWLS